MAKGWSPVPNSWQVGKLEKWRPAHGRSPRLPGPWRQWLIPVECTSV